MSRHRALAWAGVFALIVAIQMAPLPIPLPDIANVALAQEATTAELGDATDLAVVALHCAEAPAAEDLSSYLATGAPPAGCAPAVGVAVAVTEDETPLAGSPFTTDVSGSVGVPVGLGSAVEVTEDPESLPSGYEPLVGEANGVPYANPVRLDSAVAGAAVLFVNVPTPIADALAQKATAEDSEQATELAETDVSDARGAAQTATPALACEPAHPVERDYTARAPLARDLEVVDRMGSGPVSSTSRTGVDVASFQVAASGDTDNLAATGSTLRVDDGGRFPTINRNRADNWFWRRHVRIANFAAADSGSDNVAIVSNPVRISTGVWGWFDRDRTDDWRQHDDGLWMWPSDRNRLRDWRPQHTGVWVLNAAVANSGESSLAISANAVRIRNGVWFLPGDWDQWNDWRWRTHNPDDDWKMHGKGIWRWPNRINIGQLALARSGDDNVAIVSNVVRIDSGLWLLPPSRFGHGIWGWPGRDDHDTWFKPSRLGTGVWIWSGAVARSGDTSLAIVSNAVRIDRGVWFLPDDDGRTHDWLKHDERDRDGRSGGESLMVESAVTAEAPGKLEPASNTQQASNAEQAASEVDNDAAIEPPAESVAAPSDVGRPSIAGFVAPPGDAAASDSGMDAAEAAPVVEAAPEAAVESPPDAAVEAPAAVVQDASPVAAEIDAVDPSYVAPEPVVETAVDPGYSAPEAVDPVVDPGYADPGYAEPTSVEPSYVAPEPVAVEPSYSAPEPVAVPSDYVAPEPVAVAPVYEAPAPVFDPISVDSGTGEFGNDGFAGIDPIDAGPGNSDFGAGDFGGGDFGNGNAGFGAGEPVIAPGNADAGFGGVDPVAVDPGGNGGGFAVPVNAAPDPGFGDAGGVDFGNSAPEPIGADSGDGGAGFGAGGDAAPSADPGPGGGPGDE